MNLRYLCLGLVVAMFMLLFSCDLLNKNESEAPTQNVQDYYVQALDLHDALENFVVISQAYENAEFSTLTANRTKQIIDAYLDAGSKFLTVMHNMQALQSPTKPISLKSSTSPLPCNPMAFIPDAGSGLSPVLINQVANLIAETKNELDAIQAKFDKGEINENSYKAAIENLKISKTVKGVNTGIGAVPNTGVAMSIGLIIGATPLPAIATVLAAGVASGTAVTWIAGWSTAVKDSTGTTQQYIVSGVTEVGGKLPVHLIGQGATLTIVVRGYAPVIISDFLLPSAGNNKVISIKPVILSDAKSDGTSDVCMTEEPMISSSCSDVEFATGSPTPAKPSPGQGVIVTGTIIPKVANCSLTFSITGTDGYFDSATVTTNSAGQATFYIPGGAAGVFDMVSITSGNGKSYLVSYTF
jgi:hypothetical protein